MSSVDSYESLRREELIRLLEQRDAEEAGGIRLIDKGQTPPWRIIRLVQPQTFCALEPRDDIDALLHDAGRNLAAERDADAGPRVS